ncbi:MAG: transporter [Proteobacteria bacterium]|nr:transporter [Pseudomonadota bacterium]
MTLKQDPLYTIELHASYELSPAWWIAADYYWHGGGETELDGVKADDSQNNHTLGASTAFGLSPNHQLLISYQYDVDVESGPQYQTVAARFMYAF